MGRGMGGAAKETDAEWVAKHPRGLKPAALLLESPQVSTFGQLAVSPFRRFDFSTF
jgi:hypothetical protein